MTTSKGSARGPAGDAEQVAVEDLPGVRTHKEREFRYVEIASERGWFHKFVEGEDLPQPTHGGCIEERIALRTPDGREFAGLSYRGDLEGWRLLIEALAHQRGGLVAHIQGSELICKDGPRYQLSDCERWRPSGRLPR